MAEVVQTNLFEKGIYTIASPLIDPLVRGSISIFYIARHSWRAISIKGYLDTPHLDEAHACPYKTNLEVRAAWIQQLWRSISGVLPFIAPAYWMAQDAKQTTHEADEVQPGFWNHVVAAIQGPQLRELYKCEEVINAALTALPTAPTA